MKNKQLIGLLVILLGLCYQCTEENLEPVPQDDGPQNEYVYVTTPLGSNYYREQPPVYASDNISITDSLTTVSISKIAFTTDKYVSMRLTSTQPPAEWDFPVLFDANPAIGSANNLHLFEEVNLGTLHTLTCRDSLHNESLGCNMQLKVTSYDETTKNIIGNFEGTGNAPYACPADTCPDYLYQMEVSGNFNVFVDR